MAQAVEMRRILEKTAVDVYGAAVPRELQELARVCHPVPVVVSMEHGEGMAKLRTGADVEFEVWQVAAVDL